MRLHKERKAEFDELGASVLFISPQILDKTVETVEKNDLQSLDVLSDVGNKVAKELRIAYVLMEYVRPVYESFGIDIPGSNGDDSWELPLAATYIIDREGIIRYTFLDPDHHTRAVIDDVLVVLKELA